MEQLKKEIPDYVIMPYHINDASLPTILDPGPSFYPSGKDKRRRRRERERKNKKHHGKI